MKFNQKLTEIDLDNIDIKSQLEQQIQKQEKKDSGRRFDKIKSRTLNFYKTTKINGFSCVGIPLRSSVISNIENNDE